MVLRVVSYNIRKAVGLDWRRHPHRTLDVLNALEPDVAVLQEADRRLGPRPAALPHHLIEAETDLVPAPLAPNDVSLGWHGNAILLRRGIKVAETGHIELPGLEPRGAVLARVQRDTDELLVVGVHLGLLRGWRRRQLATLRRHLSDDDAAISLVAGDFNEWSTEIGLEPLADAYRVISPGRTFHAGRPAAALDKFAHGQAIRAVASGVDDSVLARRSSDHLPIWIEVEVAHGDAAARNEKGRHKAGPVASPSQAMPTRGCP
jgi:endonuclease/exonuclease/phosphatase family metal-dependent hydrolase